MTMEFLSLSMALAFERDNDSWRKALEDALETAHLEGNQLKEAQILIDLGYAHDEHFEAGTAVDFLEQGLKYLKERKRYAECLPVLFRMSRIYRTQGKHDRAFAVASNAAEFAEHLHDSNAKGLALAAKGEMLIEQASYENGLEWMFRAVETLADARSRDMPGVIECLRASRKKVPPGIFGMAVSRSKVSPRIKELLKSL
jgi:hypothetical protein